MHRILQGQTIAKSGQRDTHKTHQAIDVAPSRGSRINPLTRRFFNVLLQHAQRQGNVETFRAPMSAILADANYSSQNFEVAKAVLRGLAKTTGEWSMVNEEGEGGNVGRRWGISSLLAQAELIDDGSSITFEWSSGCASFFDGCQCCASILNTSSRYVIQALGCFVDQQQVDALAL